MCMWFPEDGQHNNPTRINPPLLPKDRDEHMIAWKVMGAIILLGVLAFTAAWGRILWNTWQYENGNAAMEMVPRDFFHSTLQLKLRKG